MDIIKNVNAQKLEAFENMIPQNLAPIILDVLRELINLARDAEVKTIKSQKTQTLTGKINNHSVVSWDELSRYIMDDFPGEDFYNIFFSHDYIDTTGLHDLLNFITLQTDHLPQSTSFFKLPKESISNIFSYVKTIYEGLPSTNKSRMEKDMREFFLTSMPCLKGIF